MNDILIPEYNEGFRLCNLQLLNETMLVALVSKSERKGELVLLDPMLVDIFDGMEISRFNKFSDSREIYMKEDKLLFIDPHVSERMIGIHNEFFLKERMSKSANQIQ